MNHQDAAGRTTRFLATFAVAICAVGLVGHGLGWPSLYSLHPGYQAMSLITGTGLALIGLGVLAADSKRMALSAWLATLAALVGLGVLSSHAISGGDRLDPMLGAILGLAPGTAGLTSVGTGVAMVLLSLLLLLRGRAPTIWVDGLLGLCFFIAVLAVASYAYSSSDLYAIPFFRTMALNTAVAVLLLAVAHLLSDPASGWGTSITASGEAGRATRRQLLFVLLPPLVGWLIMQAVNAGALRTGSALALLVVFTIAALLWLILRDGRALAALAQERGRREAAESHHRTTLEERLAVQAMALGEENQARLRKAEQATATSEGRFRLLFDSIDAGFCVIEMKFGADGTALDCCFLEVNRAFAAHTGLHRAEGRWMRDLPSKPEQHWFDIYGKVARTGQAVRFESPGKTRDDRWYDIHAFPLDDPALHHVGILFNDVTERRRAEEALRQMNATLEQRVATAVGEREQAEAALRQSQKMEALGQLTGGVAHDFNNLLTPIVGTLDLLGRRAALSERDRRLIEGAMLSAERATTLVQRLLAFARRQPLKQGPVDIAQLVEGMADLVSGTIGRQIELVVEADSNLPPALADAHQLEMAILNLCVNARDAMPDGGTLTIAASSGVPPTALELPQENYVCLTVVDNGEGMVPEILKRAVEPFYSTKGVGKGTGLGLSMVHGLAAQLEGTLDIRSEPGVGTRVDLWLPMSKEVPAMAAAVPTLPPDALVKGRAMVVDDEALVRTTTADMLTDLGFETVEFGNAREALAMLVKKGDFNLVVTDHMMPGMTGADFALALRQMRPDMRVLLVSGYAEIADIAPDIARLPKPFKREELETALARLG